MTLILTVSGVGSTFPTASMAVMVTVCLPFLSLALSGLVQGLAVALSTEQVNVAPASEAKNAIFAFAVLPCVTSAWMRS